MTKKEPIICDVEMYVIGKDESLNVLATSLEDMQDARYWLQEFEPECIYRDHFVSDMGLALIAGTLQYSVYGMMTTTGRWMIQQMGEVKIDDKSCDLETLTKELGLKMIIVSSSEHQEELYVYDNGYQVIGESRKIPVERVIHRIDNWRPEE